MGWCYRKTVGGTERQRLSVMHTHTHAHTRTHIQACFVIFVIFICQIHLVIFLPFIIVDPNNLGSKVVYVYKYQDNICKVSNKYLLMGYLGRYIN